MTRLTHAQWALRAVVVLATFVAVAAVGQPGHPLSTFWLVVGLGLAVLFGARPDSTLGVIALGYVVVAAAVHVRHGLQPSALLVAAAVVTAHVAAGLTAYTPERARPDRRLVGTWTLRSALTLVPSLLAWALARTVRGPGETWWATGTAVVVVAAFAATLALRRSTAAQR